MSPHLVLSLAVVSALLMPDVAATAGAAAPREDTAEKEPPGRDFSFLGSHRPRHFRTRDSLAIGTDKRDDARACLQSLGWRPAPFQVGCETPDGQPFEVRLRFPSPVATGQKANDLVTVEWFVAGMDTGAARRARSVVVVHESGRSMAVGRLFAATLRKQGLHAFMVQLPGYGNRATPGGRLPTDRMFERLRQSIADVRRARDAVAAMPLVDTSHIALQGTSLGGFVIATSGSLDSGYDSVWVMLAGGRLYETILEGQRDTASIRRKLAEAGIVGDRLKELARSIEPTRVAHRLAPDRTWLFSGVRDTVVPMKSAIALARAARLPTSHHVKMPTDHYTGIVLVPSMCRLMARQVNTLGPRPGRPPVPVSEPVR